MLIFAASGLVVPDAGVKQAVISIIIQIAKGANFMVANLLSLVFTVSQLP